MLSGERNTLTWLLDGLLDRLAYSLKHSISDHRSYGKTEQKKGWAIQETKEKDCLFCVPVSIWVWGLWGMIVWFYTDLEFPAPGNTCHCHSYCNSVPSLPCVKAFRERPKTCYGNLIVFLHFVQNCKGCFSGAAVSLAIRSMLMFCFFKLSSQGYNNEHVCVSMCVWEPCFMIVCGLSAALKAPTHPHTNSNTYCMNTWQRQPYIFNVLKILQWEILLSCVLQWGNMCFQKLCFMNNKIIFSQQLDTSD